MAELTFRDAVAADLPAIVAMLADDPLGRAREDASLPLAPGYLEAFAAIEAAPDQRLVVACEGGRVVGTLQLLFMPCLSGKGGWRGQIEAVRVARDRRGEAIGERLARWAIEQCRARVCVRVQLTSDNSRADAHRFWERLGFHQSHRGFKLPL
jgi:GNAT superfamily N-acetyltransferase